MHDRLLWLRSFAPSWTSAVWRYANVRALGEGGARRMVPVVVKGQGLRYCPECCHGFRAMIALGQVVPQLCPYCRSPLRWAYDTEPEIAMVAPAGGARLGEAQGTEGLYWRIDFGRFCASYATRGIPEPVMLVDLWAAGHNQGQPPSWRILARALAVHLALPARPHPQAVWRLWRSLKTAYEAPATGREGAKNETSVDKGEKRGAAKL